MGCVASRIDKEERVRICKERRMLMKQLVGFRGEFADAQLAYLRSLKNTGVTLRQFTESESLELENTTFGIALPPSPPPPLPPSPPPPPNFSPDSRKFEDSRRVEVAQEEIIEMNEENSCTPPPPLVPSSSWDFWDPFAPSSPHCEKKSEVEETIEEENWAEANTEFEEEQEEDIFENKTLNLLPEKPRTVELIDDNSSMVSWHTKDTADMAMVIWRSKKTLAGIIKELDDYFLKASAGGKDIVLLVDINSSDTFIWQEEKRIRCGSANVFNALTWSWSSKSLQCTRSAAEFYGPSEPCRLGAHSITLEKLYVEEQRLYKDIKDEEITKLEHEKKSLLLQKQEVEDRDWTKTEKTRLSVESLESDVISLKESISRSCSSILKVIDEELHPQLITITSGLMSLWRTMYECHQVQNHISQQVSHLINQESVDPTTDYHRQAAFQLKNEVTFWYNSFRRVIKSQGEYVRALCRWIRLTYCFVEDSQQSGRASAVHGLCQEWQQALDRLPDKVASEAIKSFLSAIQSIVLQQQEELNLKKKSDKLERKLQRELNSLAAMEIKLVETSNIDDANSGLSPKHPLFVKRAKVETLTKRVNEEKAKYLNSVRATKAMTLNNLRTSLPNVFQALMGFSSAYTQTLEAMLSHMKPVDSDGTFSPMC
ncbi:RB1-inducible coiled-coil protein like [Actinidia chinensis var. chinensis]|uniref:RB1-inducible coiled-coil protein like n=1 Tax=Actinidia chinensis var. chinensis TaxID=1590841 RepID=A0A2R6QAK9_ACTCC|nr:RB1-inducible coiled-coil protein like [Actinidia chinensis var. chinensis]